MLLPLAEYIKEQKITIATFPTQMGELVAELLEDAPSSSICYSWRREIQALQKPYLSDDQWLRSDRKYGIFHRVLG